MNNKRHPIIILAGATASGKSRLAITWAKEYDGVIINADSMQLYHDLSIITARPCADDMAQAPHRLYGVLPYDSPTNLGDWLNLIGEHIEYSYKNGKRVILCGGTGLYLQGFCDGISNIPHIPNDVSQDLQLQYQQKETAQLYNDLQQTDPKAATHIASTDRQRITRALMVKAYSGNSLYNYHQQKHRQYHDDFEAYWLHQERAILHERINARVDMMLQHGAIEEVEALLKHNPNPKLGIMQAIGVKEIAAMLNGHLSYDDMVANIKTNTRRYAKRQTTFFRTQLKGFKVI